MKSFLFFLVLSGIILFAYLVSDKDGFQNMGTGANTTPEGDITPEGASPGLNIPLISPRHQTLMNGATVKPFTEPSTELLAPPPGQAASVNARPAENPALQKVSSGRLQSVFESLVGFFQNDAPHLQKMGDPAIQLPLNTAIADKGRVEDELAVISKNPGLNSTLTEEDVNGIEANLAYLQKKWRVIRDLNPYFPMPPVEEGFQSSKGGGWFSFFFGGTQEGFQAAPSGPPSAAPTITNTPLQDSVTSTTIVVKMSTTGITGTAPITYKAEYTPSPLTASPTWTAVDAMNDSGSGGSGTAFTATITGLTPNTTYLVRTVSVGTTNVAQTTNTTVKTLFTAPFLAASDPPTDTTLSVMYDVTGMSPTPNIYYGTSNPPNTVKAVTQVGGTPIYQARLTGLTPNTTYYIRGGTGTSSVQYTDILTVKTCSTGGTYDSSRGSCSGGSVATTKSGSSKPDDPITLGDIDTIILKSNVEILRLESSGAVDTVTGQTIQNIQRIRSGFEQLKAEIINGDRKIETIQLKKKDVNEILMQLGTSGGSGIAQKMDSWGIDNLLSSLFPTYSAGDISGAALARSIFNKYLTNMGQNLSWELDFKYTGKAEQDTAANYASAMNDARYVADTMGKPAASNADKSTAGSFTTSNPASYGGVFSNVISGLTGQHATVSVSTGHSSGGSMTSGGVGNTQRVSTAFDWKTRSIDICKNIKARGYKPYDFGCLEDPEARQYVNFTWRGYAKTICTRLGTLYDPSIPELCGCPPVSWNGWRS
jgi:hypothetical protein